MDQENFVETIALYKLELDNEAHFAETAKILYTLTNNIATNPEEKKFQRLRLSNEKIQKYVAGQPQVMFLLEIIGFQPHFEDGEDFLVLGENCFLEALIELKEALLRFYTPP